MSKRKFRCIHCGDRFELDEADNETFEEGYFDHEPDCCYECADNLNHPTFDDYSDADVGL